MTDEEKMKLARECAEKAMQSQWPDMAELVSKEIRDGVYDKQARVQSALAAINALAPRLEQAEELLRCCIDSGHSYESEGVLHDAVRAFLSQGKPS